MVEESRQQSHLAALTQEVSRKHTADVIFYMGPIDEPGTREVMTKCREHRPAGTAFLLIATYGGDPHAAYRLGRTLQRHYKKIIACVPGRCTSAGTLIVLGAHTLTMSEFGILGPLDIQIRKSDELFEWTSGLTVEATVNALRQQSQTMFREILFDLKAGSQGQITLRTAMETATNLTIGMLRPLFSQIDPLRLGEDGRSTRIMAEYGERLADHGKNARPNAVQRLVAGYPSHNFEIDQGEARTLFRNVEKLGKEEEELITFFGDQVFDPPIREAETYLCPASREVVGEQHATINDSATAGERVAEAGRAPSATPREREPQVPSPVGTVPHSTSANGSALQANRK